MLRFSSTSVLLAALGVAANSQVAAPKQEPESILHLESKVGSFKILKFNWEAPATGRLEISFTGTLLVSDYKGAPIEPTIKGNIRREFPDPKAMPSIPANANKVVFHGKGSLVLDGTYIGVQWFGRDMKCVWKRAGGALRMSAEFDAQGNTGLFWFKDRSKARPWPKSGELRMPMSMDMEKGDKKPVLGGGGKGQTP